MCQVATASVHVGCIERPYEWAIERQDVPNFMLFRAARYRAYCGTIRGIATKGTLVTYQRRFHGRLLVTPVGRLRSLATSRLIMRPAEGRLISVALLQSLIYGALRKPYRYRQ